MKLLNRRIRAAVIAAALPLSLVFARSASADVKLPAIIGDSMVLQQGQPVAIWGTADKGEEVTVTFAGQTEKTKAGEDGKWLVKLKPLTASDKGAELTIAGKNSINLKDVLVGEVWLCSGQSNMEFVVANAKDKEAEIKAADHPTLRLFNVPKNIKSEAQSDIRPTDDKSRAAAKDPILGKWGVSSPETAPKFSAVGYFFGRELNNKLKVPVGLIHSSWGGTPAESWLPLDYLKKDEDLSPIIANFEKKVSGYPAAKEKYEKDLAAFKLKAEEAKKAGKPAPQPPRGPNAPGNDSWQPAGLYNGMIAPLVPFCIKGSIWYQGESNAGRAYQYRKLLPAMIGSWRDAWADPNQKFLIVNLANFQKVPEKPGDDSWAELREAQTLTAALPNNGQALAIDLADADKPEDIHPHNKQDVGKRLALVALGKYYGQSDVVFSGPTFDSAKFEGEKAKIKFKNADGLKATGEKVLGFQIAGEDKKWSWADAEVSGDTVTVWSKDVAKPVAVRYAWSINTKANLYNAAGLPTVPFRTDDWPGITAKAK